MHDAARAVQFLRSKAAEWRLDPQRFGAYGISAGATTSLWLAYHDDLADAGGADPIARLSTRLQVAVGLVAADLPGAADHHRNGSATRCCSIR